MSFLSRSSPFSSLFLPRHFRIYFCEILPLISWNQLHLVHLVSLIYCLNMESPQLMTSPYIFHYSNSLRLLLVSQKNYASWSHAMVIALSMKNMIGFIDGSIPCPDDTDLNLLSSWILNSVSKDISANILFFDYAFEI